MRDFSKRPCACAYWTESCRNCGDFGINQFRCQTDLRCLNSEQSHFESSSVRESAAGAVTAQRGGHSQHHAEQHLSIGRERRNPDALPAALEYYESLRQRDQGTSSVSNNSCGVQITGGSYPKLRHNRSIFGRSAELAICRQFHVNRHSMPFTAATEICKASIAALAGSGSPDKSAVDNSSTSSETSRSGIPVRNCRRSWAATESPSAHSSTTKRET